jgi:hypothetical protein
LVAEFSLRARPLRLLQQEEVGLVTSLNKGLSQGVRKLIRPSRERQPLMETTGTRAAIGALDERLQLAEETLRNLVLEVERIADAQDDDAPV